MLQYLNDWDFEDPDLIAREESLPPIGYPADEPENFEEGLHE